MDLTTWTLVALLIAVIGCLVNIVILIRRVNRLEKNTLRQISINHNFDTWQSGQQIQIEDLKGAAGHIDESLNSIKYFNIDRNQAMNDVAILLSGMKAHCFGRKAGTDKKFVESLHRINERVRDLNKY